MADSLWRVYCVTEGLFHGNVYSSVAPTQCPSNASDTIDGALTVVLNEVEGIDFYGNVLGHLTGDIDSSGTSNISGTVDFTGATVIGLDSGDKPILVESATCTGSVSSTTGYFAKAPGTTANPPLFPVTFPGDLYNGSIDPFHEGDGYDSIVRVNLSFGSAAVSAATVDPSPFVQLELFSHPSATGRTSLGTIDIPVSNDLGIFTNTGTAHYQEILYELPVPVSVIGSGHWGFQFNNGTGTQQVSSFRYMTASFTLTRSTWDPPSVSHGPAVIKLTNTSQTNVNTSTSGTLYTGFNTSPLLNPTPSVFTVSTSAITVLETGVYEAYANLYFTASSTRTNVGIQFMVNGVATGRISASAYIRNGSGHNESSTNITEPFLLNNGDTVAVECTRLSAAGTVTTPAGNSIVWLKRIL